MPIVRNGQQESGPQPVQPPEAAPARRRSPPSAEGSTKERTRAASATASRQGQAVASTTADQGQRVMGTASRQVDEVKATVREQATQLSQELTTQGRDLVMETKQQLQSQSQEQVQNLAQSLFKWGQETQALIDGRPEEAPTVCKVAQQWADKLNEVASEIEERGVEGLVEEVAHFARRRPGAFVFGAALVGFGGGRLLRSANNSAGESNGSGQAELVTSPTGGGRSSARSRSTVTAGRRNPPSVGGE